MGLCRPSFGTRGRWIRDCYANRLRSAVPVPFGWQMKKPRPRGTDPLAQDLPQASVPLTSILQFGMWPLTVQKEKAWVELLRAFLSPWGRECLSEIEATEESRAKTWSASLGSRLRDGDWYVELHQEVLVGATPTKEKEGSWIGQREGWCCNPVSAEASASPVGTSEAEMTRQSCSVLR
uniref:uncharacterized protein LOC118144510 isoform X2 n=1 Tax=Callithrix jacchus TaxID=9483 RepID=UPI0023DCFC42|nr:uncharacterized protein LOC118144510 isoform X2 [Callithrix jacchus]